MRIWLATTSMGIGGAERVVVTLARGLVDRGHEVLVWGRPGPLDEDLGPAGCQRRPVPVRPAPLDALCLRRDLAALPPDVVHAQNVRMTAVAVTACALRFGRRPRVVATFHGVPEPRSSASARILARADAVAAVSTDLADVLARRGFPTSRLRLIPTAAPRPPTVPDSLVAELRPTAGPLVVTIGRLVPEKDHARFLDAMAIVGDRHPSARFLVVGDGPRRGPLEDRARRLGLGGRVRFTGWRDDAPAIAAVADVAVLSSESEGRSVAVLEALAAGTPVVATPAPGMRELVPVDAGIVTEDRSVASLAAAVSAVLADPAAGARMGRAAARAAAALPVEPMIDAYEQLYLSSHDR
jgi:glycosyltransferase involved in cell wall biosynthesis